MRLLVLDRDWGQQHNQQKRRASIRSLPLACCRSVKEGEREGSIIKARRTQRSHAPNQGLRMPTHLEDDLSVKPESQE